MKVVIKEGNKILAKIPIDKSKSFADQIVEAYQQGRADAIEFVVDKIIFPLLNEYDIGMWENIDYIELAEKWVEFVSARKGEDDDIANDLKNWIAEQMQKGEENE